MNDIKTKAREYAEQPANAKTWGIHKRALTDAFLAGAAYALSNQWRDAVKEKPTHNNLVLAEVEVDTPEIRFCTAYYKDGIWITPDDFYYDCKVLRWIEIPEYKTKGE